MVGIAGTGLLVKKALLLPLSPSQKVAFPRQTWEIKSRNTETRPLGNEAHSK